MTSEFNKDFAGETTFRKNNEENLLEEDIVVN